MFLFVFPVLVSLSFPRWVAKEAAVAAVGAR